MAQIKSLIIGLFFIAFVSASIGIVAFWAYRVNISKIVESTRVEYENRLEEQEMIAESRIESLKQDILNRLKKCESGDLTLEDAPIILDTNHEMSIGLYMFQRDTVIYYWEKFYGEKISRKRAVEIAIGEDARMLAERIIFEETGGIFNWYNCAHRENLVAEITVIKKLLKQ